MKKKFTQGEWVSRGFEKNSNGHVSIDFKDGFITVYGGSTDGLDRQEKLKFVEKAEANAKLIAAAPDLLEATELAKQFIDYAKQAGLKLWSDKMQLMYETSAKLDNAIKKALE